MSKETVSHKIKSVTPLSPADGILRENDELLSINGADLNDIFDYHFYSDDASLDIKILRDGQEQMVHIEKELSEDLGVIFVNGLMDDYKSCRNKCVFCFIDQNPPGMRETIYFKDDDTRLSFLQGNYVTLTNMSLEDLDRIIAYKLAPINISVHATNPELRCKLLNNRFAGDILAKIDKLAKANIPMNAQVVLVPDLNDKEELDRTIGDLFSFHPCLESMSVVPIGMTKYREGLYPARAFTKDEAFAVVSQIEKWQGLAMEKYGTHFVQASDEWYITAGLPIPGEEHYDGYNQLENGVGMVRLLMDEVHEAIALTKKPFFPKKRRVTLVSGVLVQPEIEKLFKDVCAKFTHISGQSLAIRNDFFGPSITVTGLITGGDLIAQLKDKDLGDELLIPCNMLRADEEVFLDDVTLDDLRKALNIKVSVVDTDGFSFVNSILGHRS